jgi:hypothetical protein
MNVAGIGWLKKPRAGEPYLRTKSSAGRQGLISKIVAPALPSTLCAAVLYVAIRSL